MEYATVRFPSSFVAVVQFATVRHYPDRIFYGIRVIALPCEMRVPRSGVVHIVLHINADDVSRPQ